MSQDTPSLSPIIPIILCGGAGERLWPLSHADCPKQFLSLDGKETLLQNTLERVLCVPTIRAQDIITLASQTHAEEVHAQIHAKNPESTRHILAEPCGRNTAYAIAYALFYISTRQKDFPESDPFDPLIWVLPSDHAIGAPDILESAVLLGARTLCETIEQDQKTKKPLILFGIPPTHPATEYGYIRTQSPVNPMPDVHLVEGFLEKPQADRAKHCLENGHYWWNTGMCMAHLSTLLTCFATHTPDLYAGFHKIFQNTPPPERKNALAHWYAGGESLSFDRSVLEKCDPAGLKMVGCDPDWSDVGSWENYLALCAKDSAHNAIQGTVHTKQTHHCLIHTQTQTRPLFTAGVQDLVILETPQGLFILHKSLCNQHLSPEMFGLTHYKP